MTSIDDQGAVERAMSDATQKVRQVDLGPIEAAIYLALVAEYQDKRAPIQARRAREIALKHTHSHNAGVVLNRLESKGVLQVGSNRSSDRVRIPLIKDIDVFTGRCSSRRRIWPSEEEAVEQHVEPEEHVEEQALRPASARTPTTPPELPATAERLSEGFYVLPPTTPPIILRGKRIAMYKKLIELAYSLGRRLTPSDINPVVKSCGVMFPSSIINCFDLKLGLFVREHGVQASKTDPYLRALVLRPYANGVNAQVHVPEQCRQHSSLCTQEPPSVELSAAQAPPLVARESRMKSKEELEAEFSKVRNDMNEAQIHVQRVREQRVQTLRILQERVDTARETLEEAEIALRHAQEEENPTPALEQHICELGQKEQRLQKVLDVYDLFVEEVQERLS